MPAIDVPPGHEGIAGLTELPDATWTDRWDRIVVPQFVKDRLLNYLVFATRHRGRISSVGLPVHGLIVLAGPPGTGKTTLAGGLADRAARTLNERVLFVEVDPRAFPSQLLGESQRGVGRLFQRTLPEVARRGLPTIVLLDEVESLAVSRAGASLETNPVDVHRATAAVLAGIDSVARDCLNVTFVATTNHIVGVDVAFLSRADLVEEVGLPGLEAAIEILRDTLREVSAPPADAARLVALAEACVARGLDARQMRKLPLQAATARRETALHPERLTIDDVAAVLGAESPTAGEPRATLPA